MGFGTAVRAKRKERGLTLEQLSERTRITPNYLGRVENGKADPSLSVVMAIANALKVKVGELVDGRTREAAPADHPKRRSSVSPTAMELAGILDALPLDLREALEPAIRAVGARFGGRRRKLAT